MYGPGFYKREDENLLYGPNFVVNANYEMYKEEKDSYTYPIDGWYWFDDETQARENLGLPPAPPPSDEYILGDNNAGNI